MLSTLQAPMVVTDAADGETSFGAPVLSLLGYSCLRIKVA